MPAIVVGSSTERPRTVVANSGSSANARCASDATTASHNASPSVVSASATTGETSHCRPHIVRCPFATLTFAAGQRIRPSTTVPVSGTGGQLCAVPHGTTNSTDPFDGTSSASPSATPSCRKRSMAPVATGRDTRTTSHNVPTGTSTARPSRQRILASSPHTPDCTAHERAEVCLFMLPSSRAGPYSAE